MQFEVMKKAIPEECLRAFLSKGARYDSRRFDELRQFSYTSNALESFSHSAIGSLGHNKIILVLKEQLAVDRAQQTDKSQCASPVILSLSIENIAGNEKSALNDYSLYSFVNKLISGNLMWVAGKEPNESRSYSLFISIEGLDGNIYDTIALSLNKFLCDTGIAFTFKNHFITRTYCIVNDAILCDPLEDEVQQCSYHFTIVKFRSEEVYLHKISGGFINWQIVTQASNSLSFNS